MRMTANAYPTIEKMKKAAPEDRLEIAITFVDSTIRTFEHFQHSMTGKQLLKYFTSCQAHWDKIVRKNFTIIEDGEEFVLDTDIYPSLFIQRILAIPMSYDKEVRIREALSDIAEYLNWDVEELYEI